MIRDFIAESESYLKADIGGLAGVYIVFSGVLIDGQVYKTFYTDRDGFLQAGFNVIALNGGSEFIIEQFQNADGTDFHFEWQDMGDETFVPCFAVYDKESCFDGDLVSSWYFANGQWAAGDDLAVKIERFSNSVVLERAAV